VTFVEMKVLGWKMKVRLESGRDNN